MTKIAKNITELIGQTPLLELSKIEQELGLKAKILVKTKGKNVTEMLIISIEDDECALVQICGEISPEDTQKLQNIGH